MKLAGQILVRILLPIFLAAGVLQCVITFYIIRWMLLGLWRHPHALFVLGAIGIVVLLLLYSPARNQTAITALRTTNLTR